ncbi:MAG: hypothetical protein Q9226_001973 [Calogaya cf. arnoldii]
MADHNHTDGLLSALISNLQVKSPAATAQRVDSDLICIAPTQDPVTKKPTAHRCPFRKGVDYTKPYELKTIDELAADELCGVHKKMREKLMHIIMPQVMLKNRSHLLFTTVSTDPQLQTAIQTARFPAPQTSPYHNSVRRNPFASAPTVDQGQISKKQKLTIQRVFKEITVQAQKITLSQSSQPNGHVATAAARIEKLAVAIEKLLGDPADKNEAVMQGKPNSNVTS